MRKYQNVIILSRKDLFKGNRYKFDEDIEWNDFRMSLELTYRADRISYSNQATGFVKVFKDRYGESGPI